MKHPRLVQFYMSALQDPDAVRRAQIGRTFGHDRATRDEKLSELDAERQRNAPAFKAYLLAVATVAIPIGIVAVLWRSVSG